MAQTKKLRVRTDQVLKLMETVGITSNRELARRMGVSDATVSRMMRGQRISEEIIAGLMSTFSAWKFDDLFEFEPVGEGSTEAAA